VEPYTGFEPQVGEIRALRTFRIGPGGVLYPLFNDTAWGDGTNAARCPLPRAQGDDLTSHQAPDPDCTCGFYAYADEHASSDYPNARHVLAVVACWGRVIAGTRGLRAEHARVEAIWMSDAVPRELADMVASGYPGTITYTDKQTMLMQHPPTVLDCYELQAPREQRARALAFRIAVAIALVAGLFPTRWLGSNEDARVVWVLELLFFLTGAALLHRKRTDLIAKRRTLLFVAVVLWLLAPFAGPAGTLLLRLPLIQIATLTLIQRRLIVRAASHFPANIEQSPR
jgi:hypothetical protein